MAVPAVVPGPAQHQNEASRGRFSRHHVSRACPAFSIRTGSECRESRSLPGPPRGLRRRKPSGEEKARLQSRQRHSAVTPFRSVGSGGSAPSLAAECPPCYLPRPEQREIGGTRGLVRRSISPSRGRAKARGIRCVASEFRGATRTGLPSSPPATCGAKRSMTSEDGPETRGGEGLSVMVLNFGRRLRPVRPRRDSDFEALQENHEHFGIPLGLWARRLVPSRFTS